jgi:hypothetical protein
MTTQLENLVIFQFGFCKRLPEGKPLDFKEANFQTPDVAGTGFHDSGPKCLLAFSGGNVPGVIDADFQVMSVAVARILFFDTGFL